MTGCVVLGDSIALGIAMFANFMAPGGCDHRARVGASTVEIARMAPARRTAVAFVSAGSNDVGNPRLKDQLIQLRSRIQADRIVWLYPRAPYSAWAVYRVALANRDQAISLARLSSSDGIHPRDYRAAANLIFRGGRR